MSAPERVWVSPLGVFDVEMGGSIAYVPESRALAAEAERDRYRQQWLDAVEELRAQVAALTADLDLVKADNEDGGVGALSVVWVNEDWQDEFAAWYQPDKWLGQHRAVSAFLSRKVRELTADLDALVPLARLGLMAYEGAEQGQPLTEADYPFAAEQLGIDITAARALLAARKGDGV